MNQAKLDCIHDLQSENEELTNEVDSLKKQMEWLTGYNQNLMSANTALSEEIFIAKIEAYKEFAEKIKKLIKENVDEAWHRDDGNGIYDAEYVLDDIDNLLKEMVGETDD